MNETSVNNSELANMLKELRHEHNYTQEEVAKKLFVSRQAVSNWEKGISIPDHQNLISLSELYQVPVKELSGTLYLKHENQLTEEEKVKNSPSEKNNVENNKAMKTEETPFHESKEYKFLVFIAVAVIIVVSSLMPILGMGVCIGYFIFRKKLKIQNIFLDILTIICIINNGYSLYIIASHLFLDFGYSKITPL